MDKKRMGQLIKQARKVKGNIDRKKYTQESFSKLLGISRSYLGDIETGRTDPSIEVLSKIAEICELSMDYFRDKPTGNAIPSYDLIHVTDNEFSVLVIGNSMDRSGLKDGDFAIVSKGEAISNGDVVLAAINNDQTVIRRMFRVNGGVLLAPCSFDMSVQPIILDDYKDLRVIGKVVKAVIRI